MSDAPSQSQDKFIVRLPDGMRERIKRAAELNNRSMNAEIVDTLEEAYPPVSDDPRMVELHKLITKYLYNRDSFTDDEEFEMNSLIVDIRLGEKRAEDQASGKNIPEENVFERVRRLRSDE